MIFIFQSVKRVIGVEIIENAVKDAKANAELNGEWQSLAVFRDSKTHLM